MERSGNRCLLYLAESATSSLSRAMENADGINAFDIDDRKYNRADKYRPTDYADSPPIVLIYMCRRIRSAYSNAAVILNDTPVAFAAL